MVWVLQQLSGNMTRSTDGGKPNRAQQADTFREEQDMIDAEWRKVVEWANPANVKRKGTLLRNVWGG